MKSTTRFVCVLAASLLAGAALAQGPASGPGPGRGPGSRWGNGVTPGWAMMSEAERNEHRTAMQGMKTYEDCAAYRDKHREQMAARAKEKGRTMPAEPRRDICAGLKKP